MTPFERLTAIYLENGRLLYELGRLRPRIEGAREFLADPNCPNPTLGRAYLERLAAKRSELLARLRARREEARALPAPPTTPSPQP